MWKCLECGRKFRTVNAAEKAASDGCPNCGGVDVDLVVDVAPTKDDIDARLKRIFLTRKPKGDKQ
jgi:predicted  nucleic acid-binding Zn-ribbon protein